MDMTDEEFFESVRKRTRIVWVDGEIKALIKLWQKYFYTLKSMKRNRRVYKKISDELRFAWPTDHYKTGKDVHLKIANLSKQFRRESARAKAGLGPTTWLYYRLIKDILSPINSSEDIKELDPLATHLDEFDNTGEESSFSNAFDEESPQDKKKRVNWLDSEIKQVLKIWNKYADDLRKTKRNRKIYSQIAEELQSALPSEPAKTTEDIQIKIANMSRRWRRERKKLVSGVGPTTWYYYDLTGEILLGLQEEKQNETESCSDVENSEEEEMDDSRSSLLHRDPYSDDEYSQPTKRPKRCWTVGDIENLVSVWGKYLPILKKVKRNSDIYRLMGEDFNKMSKSKEPKTTDDVRTKVSILTKQWRRENMKESPPAWQHYDLVSSILATGEKNLTKSGDDEYADCLTITPMRIIEPEVHFVDPDAAPIKTTTTTTTTTTEKEEEENKNKKGKKETKDYYMERVVAVLEKMADQQQDFYEKVIQLLKK